ncbi:AtpZ/AtpI family protein [Paenirhodobacter hankyongi]|uniref:AtpZ/AtpI family protein n=1 Tax=Paenirhodobacter hankyongi TaxID=2294033 RepID=A0A421BW04_9RHOB|nr:AtpZ/AtpI family protein [Sinirhodobacter hankyongi]RLL72455.1 AtpZ/AtpI family protein [Sinirhodobacter hankyongi]
MIDDADPKLRRAVNEARGRVEAGQKDPEPPLARRFGQIGVLGWVIVGPTLAGLALGHWIDGALNSGITVSAALTMLGAGLGLYLAFRWMHQQ